MKYYAAYSQHSPETSRGRGDDSVASFDTRAARDAWVRQSPALATRPITRREALRLAGRLRRQYAKTGGHLAHMHVLMDGDIETRFVRAF